MEILSAIFELWHAHRHKDVQGRQPRRDAVTPKLRRYEQEERGDG